MPVFLLYPKKTIALKKDATHIQSTQKTLIQTMKSVIQALTVAALIIFTTSCHKINADGPVVTKTLNFNQFTAVSSSVDATVTFTQSPQYKVEVSAQQAIHDKMRVEVVDGELRFYYPGSVNIGRHDHINIYISGPEVYGFSINGSGELRSSDIQVTGKTVKLKISGSGSTYISDLSADAIEATVSGSGKMTIGAGTVHRESCEISGSGEMDFNNLSADDVTARISGSGSIYTKANKSLDVRISGSGKVYYRGTPTVTTSISGSGKVQPN